MQPAGGMLSDMAKIHFPPKFFAFEWCEFVRLYKDLYYHLYIHLHLFANKRLPRELICSKKSWKKKWEGEEEEEGKEGKKKKLYYYYAGRMCNSKYLFYLAILSNAIKPIMAITLPSPAQRLNPAAQWLNELLKKVY